MVSTATATPSLPGCEEWIDILAERNHSVAARIEAISRRRDTREKRAKLTLLLLERRAPLIGSLREPWYVRGGVARMGIPDIARAWRARFHEVAPCERTLRSHLSALVRGLVIVKEPGPWLPWAPVKGAERPRRPDSIHILETDELAEWWAEVGYPRLQKEPGAALSPRRWARLFSEWREMARHRQLEFPELRDTEEPEVATTPEPVGAPAFSFTPGTVPILQRRPDPDVGSSEFWDLADVVKKGRAATRWEWAVAFRTLVPGLEGDGRALRDLLTDFPRALGVSALLLRSLAGGRYRIENRLKWALGAFGKGRASDMRAARALVSRWERPLESAPAGSGTGGGDSPSLDDDRTTEGRRGRDPRGTCALSDRSD